MMFTHLNNLHILKCDYVERGNLMIRIVLAALVAGIAFGVTVATLVGKISIEGLVLGLTSIVLLIVLSAVVYIMDKKSEASVSHL